jgi:hypothetical protein
VEIYASLYVWGTARRDAYPHDAWADHPHFFLSRVVPADPAAIIAGEGVIKD